MPENNLFEFEYAVVRMVPKVEREEFLNVGVVLYCAKEKFLQMKYYMNEEKMKIICDQAVVEEIKLYLQAFENICAANINAGPIARLPLAGRFRWLTATRSTVLQTSKVHPGLCADAAEMLTKIFKQQVL